MKNNRNVKIFNRPKKSGVLVSDYMRDYQYFELNEKQREKLIEMLKEDLAEQENILKEMLRSRQMIDIHWTDLTKTPDEPNQNDWIVLTNEQWERVKLYIEQLKELEERGADRMKSKPMQIAMLPFDGVHIRYKAICPKCKTILEGGWMFIRKEIPKHGSRDFYCSHCGQKIDIVNTETIEWGEQGTDYDKGGYCPY